MEAQYESLKKFPEGISKSFLYTVFRFCGNSNKNRLMPRRKTIFFFVSYLIRRSRKSKNQNQFIFNNLQKRHKKHKKCCFCFFKNIKKGYFMSENTISPDIECCECDSCVDCQYFLYFWGECQEALPAHIIKNYGFCVYNAPECGKPIAPGNFAAEGLIPIVHKSFRCRHLTSDDGDHFYDQ